MKQITLRGIPDDVTKAVKEEARQKGLSLNKAFLSVLQGRVSRAGKARKEEHHDLDPLFGVWAKDEADGFDEALDLQRKVDESVWKRTTG